jgi:hypothetical protein
MWNNKKYQIKFSRLRVLKMLQKLSRANKTVFIRQAPVKSIKNVLTYFPQ